MLLNLESALSLNINFLVVLLTSFKSITYINSKPIFEKKVHVFSRCIFVINLDSVKSFHTKQDRHIIEEYKQQKLTLRTPRSVIILRPG